MLQTIRYILNTFLCVSLGVQVFLMVTLKAKGYWEIPGWVTNPIVHFFNEGDSEVELKHVRIYPGEGVVLTDVNLFSEECICPVIQIGEIRIASSGSNSDQSGRYHGMASKGVIYFPDQYLPEKDNLKLVDNISFRFSVGDGSVSFGNARAEVSNLKIASMNQLTLPLELFRGNEPVEDSSSGYDQRQLLDKLREVRYLHQFFENAHDAFLGIAFEYDEATGLGGAFNLFSTGSSISTDVVTKNLFCYGDFTIDGSLRFKDGIHGELESLRYGSNYHMNGISLWAKYNPDQMESLLPNEVELYIRSLDLDGREVDYLSTRIHPKNWDVGTLDLSVGIMDQAVSLAAVYDIEKKAVDVEWLGDFNPIKIIEDGWLKKDIDVSLIQVEGLPRISGRFHLDDWVNLSDLEFALTAKGIRLKGAEFDYARGLGEFNNGTFSLSEFSVFDAGHVLRGHLSKSLETTEYRYMLTGRGIPTTMNPMFRSWWSDTWSNFEFNGNPADADIDIWGKANDQTKKFAFGRIALEGVSYKGLRIQDGLVRINTLSKITHLFDMNINHRLGSARGEFMTVFRPDQRGVVSKHLDFYTNIPLHHVAPLVGESLDVYVRNTNPEAAPTIWARGTIIDDDFPQYAELDELKIDIQSDTPFEFFGVGIDSIQAEVLKHGDRVVVAPAEFTFANGVGAGEFRLVEKESIKILEFSAKVEDFDYKIALDKIAAVRKSREAVAEENQSNKKVVASKADKGPSFMDLTLEGSFPLGDWEGLRATGRVELDDPLIHRVHLFGGFSRMMDNAELNLGSFSLKRATSPLLVEGKKIKLENLELSGPSSRVRSKGVIDLEDASLDFRLKAYPLREVKFPVIAGIALILRPFTQMFEVKVSGSLAEPEWKLVIDPSGL